MEIFDSSNESHKVVDYEAQIIQALKTGGIKSARNTLSNIQDQLGNLQALTYRQKTGLNAFKIALNESWWSTIKHGAVSIRRSAVSDLHFFSNAYENPSFRNLFGESFGWKGELSKALENNQKALAGFSGTIFFSIIFQDSVKGLISLSQIDLHNLKSEFAIGFPNERPQGIAHKACLLFFDYYFWIIGLNKIYTLVYSENRWSSRNSEKLGLLREGFIKDYLRTERGFKSVEIFGLTRSEALENRKLLSTVWRRINRDWSRFH